MRLIRVLSTVAKEVNRQQIIEWTDVPEKIRDLVKDLEEDEVLILAGVCVQILDTLLALDEVDMAKADTARGEMLE